MMKIYAEVSVVSLVKLYFFFQNHPDYYYH